MPIFIGNMIMNPIFSQTHFHKSHSAPVSTPWFQSFACQCIDRGLQAYRTNSSAWDLTGFTALEQLEARKWYHIVIYYVSYA